MCSRLIRILFPQKLRIAQPDLPRPYRAWGYPITPVIFLLVTGFMMYYLLTERPLQSALGTLIMISGLLIYAVFPNRAVPGLPTASPSRESRCFSLCDLHLLLPHCSSWR